MGDCESPWGQHMPSPGRSGDFPEERKSEVRPEGQAIIGQGASERKQVQPGLLLGLHLAHLLSLPRAAAGLHFLQPLALLAPCLQSL